MRQWMGSDHLAAAPLARWTFDQAQRLCMWTENDLRVQRPDLFVQGNESVKWMTDRSLPDGVRVSIAMAESADRLLRNLTDERLRILIADTDQLMSASDVIEDHELQHAAWDVLREERSPFELLWVESRRPLQVIMAEQHVAEAFDRTHLLPGFAPADKAWETGRRLEFELAGMLIRDDVDWIEVSMFLRQTRDPYGRPLRQLARDTGFDMFAGPALVIPHTDRAYPDEYFTAAPVVLRAKHEHGYMLEGAPNLWVKAADGTHRPDPEFDVWLSYPQQMLPLPAGLLMLLSSINVSAGPAPEQQTKGERRAVKHGAIEPVYITVRQNRKRDHGDHGEAKRHLTTRHEVVGHFKHWGEETRMYQSADPKKHRYTPDRGWHVRYWSPPHVRGPEDAPLVIKPRKMGGSWDTPGRNAA